MCDLYSLTKLFLWGGYCYQHFHKKTTTDAPTTDAPTTAPPTTASCEDCRFDAEYSFLSEEIEALCSRMPVSIDGTEFTFLGQPCGEFFEINVFSATCNANTIGAIQLEMKYKGSVGSMRSELGSGISGIDVISKGMPSPQSFCIGVDSARVFNFKNDIITGIRLTNIEIVCNETCA